MPKRVEPAAEAYGYPLILRQLLETAIDARSTAEILGSDGSRRSYTELAQRIGRLAASLEALGVGPGETVAVMDWDSHRYLECYFAVPMMGAVLQTVNVRLSPEQIAYTLASTGARIMLFHADFAALAAELRERVPGIATWLAMRDGAEVTLPFPVAGEYEALLAAATDGYVFADCDEDAVATTFHTTGTTGLPKAVAFTHRQIVLHTLVATATFALQPDALSLRRDDVYMPLTPMFHVHAWGIPFVATMLGIKQVYPGRYMPERLLALQRDEGVTFSHCVPTVLQMLIDEIGPEPLARRWKVVIGGSALPTALRDAAEQAGITAYAGYGMSETAPLISLSRPGDGAEDALCRAGRPVLLVHARIVDEDMRDVPADGAAQGELVLRAPWLAQSYSGDRDASDALWRDGWLHTQDVAARTPEGDLVIRDRLKDVIKTGGEWVSSVQMEDLARRHPGIADAAFVGAPCPRWGERPVAFVVTAGDAPDLDDLRDHLRHYVEQGMISRYALPDRLVRLDALPRTSVGKIDKRALRGLLPPEELP